MATFGHLAVGLLASRFRVFDAGPLREQRPLAAALWCSLACLPDADVVAFTLGIPYGAPWGHRGAAHSIVFAALLAAALAGITRLAGQRALLPFLTSWAVIASHGILDAFTDGGKGIALFWPFSDARVFASWRPIPVAPIGVDFLSARGWHCVVVELLLFAPLVIAAFWPRRRKTPMMAGRDMSLDVGSPDGSAQSPDLHRR